MEKYDIKKIIYIILLIATILSRNFILLILTGIFIILGEKNAKKDKLSKIDLKNNGEYFRDIIKGYTPAELSYIDNFNIEDSDIVATLLNLSLKGVITLNENPNTIEINNVDTELSNNERYILDIIKSNKWNEFNKSKFLLEIINDALKNELIKESKTLKKGFGKIIIIWPICFCILITMAIFVFKNSELLETTVSFLILAFLIMIVMFLPIMLIVFYSSYNNKMQKEPYIRTKKGEQINANLEGLKNYLNDYSLIEEKEYKELELWEDYLIYSVIFRQNNKLTEETIDKYIKN